MELIVVITILAILGTIGFISIQGYSSSARDSVRVTDLKSMERWLSLYMIQSDSYPDPDNSIAITASWSTIGFQWYFGNGPARMTKLNAAPIDPVDRTNYVYSVNLLKNKFELLGFLEGNSGVAINLVNTAFALDNSKKNIKVSGDALGILLMSGSLVPVQEDATIKSAGKLDIINTANAYVMQFSTTEKITGTGIVLKAGTAGGWLIWYWPFNESSGTGTKDLSSNGNDGILQGTTLSAWWKSENLLTFNWGENDCITVTWSTDLNIKGELSLSAWINNTGTGVGTQANLGGMIIAKHHTHFARSYDLYLPVDTHKLQFDVCDVNNVCYNLYSTSLINYNQKYFVTTTYSKATWKIKLYIDGKLDSISDNWLVNVMNTSIPVTIWCYLGSADGSSLRTYFMGGIGEPRIYSRALSESEITSLYNATK